jgi:hypothetical protein
MAVVLNNGWLHIAPKTFRLSTTKIFDKNKKLEYKCTI